MNEHELRSVALDNQRNHQAFGGTDGMTPEVSKDIGLTDPQAIPELLARISERLVAGEVIADVDVDGSDKRHPSNGKSRTILNPNLPGREQAKDQRFNRATGGLGLALVKGELEQATHWTGSNNKQNGS
ncbi:MAG: hypothetical protein WCJ24_02665 [Candidatus Saccharibacteria bacterium]